jgi:acylphosphatase
MTLGLPSGFDPLPPPELELVRLTAWISGSVQGVGFRWWCRAAALELGLAGYARNLPDGRVELVVEGAPKVCQRMIARVRSEERSIMRRPGKVKSVVARWTDPKGATGFYQE